MFEDFELSIESFESEDVEQVNLLDSEFSGADESLELDQILSSFIRECSQKANLRDDYLNPRLREKISLDSDVPPNELELLGLQFFQDELSGLRGAIANAIVLEDWLSVIDICDSLVIFFNLKTYWEDLELTLQTALNAAQKAANRVAEARILNNLGHTFRLLGKAHEGIEFCEKSVDIFEQIDDVRGKSEAIYTLGYLYRSVGQWSQSIENFESCLSLFEQLRDFVGKAGALDGLGQVYTKQDNFTLAKQVLASSLQLKEELKDRFQISITCNNLGKVYLQEGDLDTAESLFKKSLAIKQEINDMQGQGVSFNELGEIFRRKSDFSRAMEYYNKSLNVKDQISTSSSSALVDNHGKGLTYMRIGLLHEDQYDIENAISYWQKALDTLNDYSPENKRVQGWIQKYR